MTSRDVLKEAIAEAKAVKQAAIENAKAALNESFTPHLKSMLAAKLEEMEKVEDVEIEEEELDEMDAVSWNEKNNPTRGATGERDPKKVGQSTSDYAINEEDELDEEELDLEEMLAELDLDESEDIEESEITEAEEIDETEINEEEISEEDEEVEDEEVEGEEDEMEDEEINLEDMSEDDLKGFIEDVISDMVSAGELEAGEEFDSEGEEEIEVEDEDAEDIMEEEIEEEYSDYQTSNLDNQGKPKKKKREEGYSKDEELEEALQAIEVLKTELQEVNLLNAKLLYTNKIFKAKNLTEDRKVKVLKAFDKATTVKEAKVIFETLNEGIETPTVKKSPISEIKNFASKATGVVAESKTQPIVENSAFLRMQQLAGLKKLY